MRALRHALSREVGMISREQVASDDLSMVALISSVEQGAKVVRLGGAGFGRESG
jgi:hypothetical protein